MPDETSIDPHIGRQTDVDRMLAELAGRQHGVVSRSQLLGIGLSRKAIERRLERGRLHSIHRGVYALGHRALREEATLMAAVLLGGDGAAASHGAAGTVWRLRRSAGGVIDVTAPRRRRTRSPVRFHHEALPPDEVTVERRIPVTTVPRTLLDLASVLDAHGLERAINEAEVRRLRDRLSLLDLLERHPRRAGTATLRSLLAAGLVGAGVTRSELEDRFLAFLDAAELERPGLNVPLRVGRGWVEVDCLWRAQRLIVELDGRAAHATAQAFERDRARDRALQAAGWRVVRITWRQLHERPEELALELSALLAWQPLARHPPTAARHP